MGSSKSRAQRPDTSVAMETYVKELGEKYETLQEKLRDLTQEYPKKGAFNNKVCKVDEALLEYQRTLKKLAEASTTVRIENETLKGRCVNIEEGIRIQKQYLSILEEGFEQKIAIYESALIQSKERLLELKKETGLQRELIDAFKLNKIAHANGIYKDSKRGSPTRSKKQSTKRLKPTPCSKPSSNKKVLRGRKNTRQQSSPIRVSDSNMEQENGDHNYIRLATDRCKIQEKHNRGESRNKRLLEDLDINTLQ